VTYFEELIKKGVTLQEAVETYKNELASKYSRKHALGGGN